MFDRNTIRWAWRRAANWLPFVIAILAWPFLIPYELPEEFFEYSRAHEDWELDEIVVLIFNLFLALCVSQFWSRLKLRRALKARDDARHAADLSARHDPLTGLLNRRAIYALYDWPEEDVPDLDPVVVALMDLDRFKPVNDLHGHAAGDDMLREVAARALDELQEICKVGRVGGDEFALVFFPSVSPEAAERAVRRLITRIEEPLPRRGASLSISCSLGLALWRRPDSFAEVVRKADKALYAAKSEGRGRHAWYDADLDRRSTELAQIEADLRVALTAGHIHPKYQPVFELQTRKLRAVEVLARWQHPTRGNIPPNVFIEIAEDHGLISQLGWGILRQACFDAKEWQSNLRLAVNVSPHQFHDREFVSEVIAILEETGFDPHRLEIEITESAVIRDLKSAEEAMTRLQSYGVSIALDDFGTGYSSLSNLRKLPFDRIKIDRSFVTNIASEPSNQKIVAGIMALAHGLELDVTAEGIETQSDLSYLEHLNCSLGQGFYFDAAVPAEDVPWLIATKWQYDSDANGLEFQQSVPDRSAS